MLSSSHMAKDPAFLFYSNDFDSATKFFTNEQVGKYIRLMIAQHQHGHLSREKMNFICISYDKDVFDKFIADEQGLFFNERLEIEITKRKKYALSRGNNRRNNKNISNSYDDDMGHHMENENENENKDDNEIENGGVYRNERNIYYTEISKKIVSVISEQIDKNKLSITKPVNDPKIIQWLIEQDNQSFDKVEQMVDYLSWRDITSKYSVHIFSVKQFREKIDKLYSERQRFLSDLNKEDKPFHLHPNGKTMFVFHRHKIEDKKMEKIIKNSAEQNFRIIYLEPNTSHATTSSS